MIEKLWVKLYRYSPNAIKRILRRLCASNVLRETESEVLRTIWNEHYGVTIGKYTYGCFNDSFPAGTIIGRYCSISKNVKALNANHPIEAVCLTPFFYNKSLGYDVEDVKRSTLSIGNDVWIGYGSIILSKCEHIGNGAVIGAGSVVTKDVPAYAVVAGNPARVLRYRFDEDTRDGIEQTRWWDNTPDKLIDYKEYMNDPSLFIRKWDCL